jgi:hypothetical protein
MASFHGELYFKKKTSVPKAAYGAGMMLRAWQYLPGLP